MYNAKLVSSIKVNGKILREFKDKVFVNFGSEYSILLKNLNTVRALVKVFIDGESVVPNGLVINAGQSIDLERWVKNGNLTEGNRFKFIERTAAVENGPRGIKEEDGLVRIEYQYEVPTPILVSGPAWSTPAYNPNYPYPRTPWHTTYGAGVVTNSVATHNVGGAMRGVDFSKGESTRILATSATNATLASMGIANDTEVHDGAATMDWCDNDVGITVPGSKSTQKFSTTTIGQLETTVHSIILRIVGDLGNNKPVTEPVTTKAKPKCVTCGHQNKATAKYCNKCGTALEIFA